ncbi:MAG: DMT family transporter [Alphaproteobacteria bacterium]|nr:DMT family transporter [Alphaproteobacteria bacterium]
MSSSSQAHARGLAVVAISALLFSTPGLFTRGVSASGWDVIFWRAVFGALFTGLYLAWRGRLKFQLSNLGRSGWANALVWATGTIAYLHAYKLTSIANVSMIYGSAPIITALVAWFWFRERPRTIVIAASLAALAGVAVIAAGSLGTLHLGGDALALWMTCTVAIGLSIFRKYPQTPAAGAAIVSSLLVLPPSLLWGDPFTVSGHEILILALFGLVFSVASVLLNEGSKLLPSSEAALISNLEVPIQPVLAWLAFAEIPPAATFIGGALILIAIAASAWPFPAKALD